MCKQTYEKEQRDYNKLLETDRNAIFQPLKNQGTGNIEALRDEDGNLETNPQKVAEIHAKELRKTISNKEPFEFKYANYGHKVKPATVGELKEEELTELEMDHKKVRAAIKEMTSSKSKDPNGISKEMIKNIQDAIIPSLSKLGRLSLQKGTVPECLKTVHCTVEAFGL